MKKRTVSLILGSGGARGFAHIGVIQWLTEQGFEIRSIAGSSMGALIGGIYATGKLDVYTRWACELQRRDIVRLLDFSLGRNALFKGERIINVLRELIGDHAIEDLPISFTAVAADIAQEKEVWLNCGPLFDAIRASIAIPMVFTPFRYGDRLLLDGGLVNPVPIAPTLNDKTDITIAVNLSAKAEMEFASRREEDPAANNSSGYRRRISQFVESIQEKLGQGDTGGMDLFEIVSQSMETMQNSIARLKLAAYTPDIIVGIPRNTCAFFEFHRAKEMIAIGRDKSGAALANYITQ